MGRARRGRLCGEEFFWGGGQHATENVECMSFMTSVFLFWSGPEKVRGTEVYRYHEGFFAGGGGWRFM